MGADYHADSLTEKLTSKGIDYKGLVVTDEPTTTKIRVMGAHQQMLRLDFEDDRPVGSALQRAPAKLYRAAPQREP